jgi:tetratricopeptide (TPR) repeat protein
MNNGDLAVEKGEIEKAMKEYNAASEMFPENAEMKFWTAVTLANVGKLEVALPLFKEVFTKNENWRILTPRLIDNQLLTVSEEDLTKILEQ